MACRWPSPFRDFISCPNYLAVCEGPNFLKKKKHTGNCENCNLWQLSNLTQSLLKVLVQALSQNCGKRLLAYSCLSVCPPAWNNSALTGRIFMKSNMYGFFRKSLKKSSFTKIGQECWVLYMKTNIHFYHISLISSYSEK